MLSSGDVEAKPLADCPHGDGRNQHPGDVPQPSFYMPAMPPLQSIAAFEALFGRCVRKWAGRYRRVKLKLRA